jgi:hypothetical protein
MSVQARLNIDTRPFVLFTYPASRVDDGTIEQDAGRAVLLAQFTLMGKKLVTIPVTMTADVGNTGDGTVTGVAAGAGGAPIVGTWELECVEAIADGGVFKLTDPNGVIVAPNLVLNAGAGNTTTFTVAGITFTVTDGAVNFIVGDLFTLAITANGKWVPFDPANVDGSEVPQGIYVGADIAAADLVAGDVVDKPIIFHGIRFDADKLVFDDGVTTLDTQLSSGLTVREELAHLTMIALPTRTTSLPENA